MPDGINANHTLVKEGWCWWYRKYASGNAELEKLEKDAREAGREPGADSHVVPPWDWRKRKEHSGSPQSVPDATNASMRISKRKADVNDGWNPCPLLRASDEHCFTVRVLRAKRAPATFSSSFSYFFPAPTEGGQASLAGHPCLPQLRPSNEALPGARVPGAREQRGCPATLPL